MPWRRKPASFLRYWSGPVKQDENFKAVIVYCVGAQGYRCHHNSRLDLADLPDWDWHDVSAHLRCTQCCVVGWADVRPVFPPPRMGTNALQKVRP